MGSSNSVCSDSFAVDDVTPDFGDSWTEFWLLPWDGTDSKRGPKSDMET
jgi:hypothetical protein